MAKKKLSFEESMERLQEIADMLSAGKLPLDDMMKLYEEGQALSKACLSQLEAYEGRLETLHAAAATEDEAE